MRLSKRIRSRMLFLVCALVMGSGFSFPARAAEEAEEVFHEIAPIEETVPSDTYEIIDNSTADTAVQMFNGKTCIVNLEEAYKDAWYRVILSEDSCFSLNLQHDFYEEGGSYEWRIYLYSEKDLAKEIVMWLTSNKDENMTTPNIGLPAGRYFLRVRATRYSAGQDLSMTARYEAAPTRETEINNTFAEADTIVPNITYIGALQQDYDKDVYSFTLDAPGTIQVEFRHEYSGENNTGYQTYLFSEEDKTNELRRWTYDRQMDQTVTSEYVGLRSGTYYLRVEGNIRTDYEFRIRYEKTPFWEKERNDDFPQANPIEIGKEYSGLTHLVWGKGDSDFYSFELGKDANVRVFFSNPRPETEGLKYRVELYDSLDKTKPLNTYESAGRTTELMSRGIELKKGLYYIKVDKSGGGYDIIYRFRVEIENDTQGTGTGTGGSGTGTGTGTGSGNGTGSSTGTSGSGGAASSGSGGASGGGSSSGNTSAAGTWKKAKNGKYWYDQGKGKYPASEWLQVDGKWYYFDKSGYMVTGWKKIGKKWYYFGGKKDGAMKTGWKKISGKWYYLDKKSGAMKTGWLQDGGKWYYMDKKSGAMKTGWLKSGGKWYYLNGKGQMLANTSRKIGKKTYRFDKNGVCTNA